MLLALGGICTALSLITLLGAGILSINTFALLTLSSCFIGIMHIEGGIKYSLLSFVSVSVLSFILPVTPLNSLYYVGFFGYYPILKSYIERLGKLKLELIVKGVFFVIISIIGMYAVKLVTGEAITEAVPLYVVPIFALAVLFIIDYAQSIFYAFYVNKLRNKIRR